MNYVMAILGQESCSRQGWLMICWPGGGHNVISTLGNVIPAQGNVNSPALDNVIAIKCWIQTEQGLLLLRFCVCSCFVLGQVLLVWPHPLITPTDHFDCKTCENIEIMIWENTVSMTKWLKCIPTARQCPNAVPYDRGQWTHQALSIMHKNRRKIL